MSKFANFISCIGTYSGTFNFVQLRSALVRRTSANYGIRNSYTISERHELKRKCYPTRMSPARTHTKCRRGLQTSGRVRLGSALSRAPFSLPTGNKDITARRLLHLPASRSVFPSTRVLWRHHPFGRDSINRRR